jgi:hypothetical protein
MSFDLAETLRAALDDGCLLAKLEATLLARAEMDDQIAAAWLYAWAYDAVRPPRDDLAARITGRGMRDHAPQLGVMFTAAIDRCAERTSDGAPGTLWSRPRAANPGRATVQTCGARQREGCAGPDRDESIGR